MSQYTLMHKNIPVAEVDMSEYAVSRMQILNREHMPLGISLTYPELSFERWNKMRAIPDNRQGLDKIKKAVGNIEEAKIKAMLVSLTDCYWLKENEKLTWEDANYHDNGFDTPFLKAVCFSDGKAVSDIRTPDLTTDGVLEKTWVTIDGIPTLLKFSSEKRTESANEVIAYRLAKEIGLNAAEYMRVKLSWNGSICGTTCFIRDNSREFVNAFQIAEKYMDYQEDLYRRFAKMGMQQDVDKMILFDILIHNIDRHEKNFGIIRDPETLNVLCFAPLFDNGTSFGIHLSKNTCDMGEMKPFCDSRQEHLALLKHLPFDIPDQEYIEGLITKEYQAFEVPEERYETAIKDLENTYQLVLEHEKIWGIENDELVDR